MKQERTSCLPKDNYDFFFLGEINTHTRERKRCSNAKIYYKLYSKVLVN